MDCSAEYTDISLICNEDSSFLHGFKQNKQSNCDNSLSDVEVLRESNDHDYLMKKEIEKKRRILKLKRQDLCDRLMSYKLMQFSAAPDLTPIQAILNNNAPHQEKVNFETPSSTTDCTKASLPGKSAAIYNEHQILSNNLNEDSMMALAIQASLDDYAKTKGNSSKQSSLPEDDSSASGSSASCSSASGFSGKDQTESENRSYSEVRQNPSSNINIAGSSRSPKKPFAAVNPLRRWNSYQPETENQKQHQEVGNDLGDIKPVQEDFMEGERYIGDKGKRPLSGKYSYKKRSKSAQVDSDEQPPGNDLPKKV